MQLVAEIEQLEQTSSQILQNTIEAYVPMGQLSVHVLLSDEKYIYVEFAVLQNP